ncbi:MAG: cytochrome c family protein [Salinarimonadaceae bacterium]|nr:MAG: cytochrome c family protein [Salinarimonadaceae bacterium]
MDSFELNKIMGAVLGALLFVVGLSIFAGMMFTPRPATHGSLVLPEVEAGATIVADVPQVEPLPIRLASASLDRGESAARACASCHSFNEGGDNRVGPNLWDVVEQGKANNPGFGYSAALSARAADGEVWGFEELDAFFENPRAYLPGTTMAYAGLRNPQTRADIILYMRSLSDNPAPLPEAAAVVRDDEEAEAEVEVETPAAQ